jgi:hypothetical protein
VPRFPDEGHHLLGDLRRVRCCAPDRFIVGHRDRGTDIADVGPGKTGLHVDHQNAGLAHVPRCAGEQLDHGAGLAAAVVGAVDLRPAAHQRARPDLAAQHARQQSRRLDAARAHVDMRVAAIGDEGARLARHRVSHVGVQVERRDHRHVCADAAADLAEQVAIAILGGLGDHRTVQREQDAVERPSLLDDVQDRRLDVRPARRRQLARGRRVGRDGEGRLPALALGDFEKAAQLAVRAAQPDRDVVAVAQHALGIGFEVGRQTRKSVGLVLRLGDQDARGHRRSRLDAGHDYITRGDGYRRLALTQSCAYRMRI